MISILNDIWHTLNIELGRRGVENKVPCFLNMIIPKIAHLILNNDMKMVTAEERNQFEKKCNEIIESALLETNFNNFYQQSIKDRNAILNYDDFTIKCILEEISDIERLPNNEFPLIRYFFAINYSTYDTFYNLFKDISDKEHKYPILTTYFKYTIENPDKIKILESFQFINPFVVYVLEKYSNKLTRNEAKQSSIKNELEKDEKMKNLFVNFKKGWNSVYKILTNFDCHGGLTPKNIDENDCLAYVLNDTFEDGFGKYMATYYNDIISIHNEILKSLIPENNLKYYLKPFQNQTENYITVQDATYNEIISFNKLYDSIKDVISVFSNNKYYKEQNGKLSYTNYKNVVYDFQRIEVELCNLLLPGKILLKSKDEQNFISYKNERFTKNFNIIYNFKQKLHEERSLSKTIKNNIKHAIITTHKLISVLF
ncbi:hypothetical protein BCR36DRAFT_587134 [Piromyces finnis]|uniref:Uncharacterized protein n=1 Tax=Piromyces finnis TaxID=1754191 RepID=A0A1Y1UWM1_9FUNG|nr:hypothetical protein BCR36DRAFT_587134 [Piromyces finnis]|eukprot:ORX42558.1 hypothetical protein BCR36DRAFT_587134 [Piromyces finnis]